MSKAAAEKIRNLTLEQKIGQLIVAGFPGKCLSEEFLRLVREYKVGNVILFSHNVESREQLSELTCEIYQEIENSTGILPLISMDEEGGVVSRLPRNMAVMPSAMAQGRTGDEKAVFEGARIVGQELRALGINFNLAPVLDINSNRDNPVIGVRSFGETPEQVIRFGRMAMKGYLEAGILCSGKHFPGHGDTDLDSHLSLPVIHADKATLEGRELAPFARLIREGLPALTIAHVLMPALEPEPIPCTMSEKVVTGILRGQMGFDGLIISDCMEMAAIREHFGVAKGAVEGLKAGIDLIFISHTASCAEEAIREVRKAIEAGELPMERIDSAVSHVLAAKERFGKCVRDARLAGTEEQAEFAEGFLSRTICPREMPGDGGKIFSLGENPLFIGVEPGRVTLVSDGEEKSDFSHLMQESFGGEAVTLGMEPTKEEIQDCAKRALGKSSLVIGTLNAHLKTAQLWLLEALGEMGIPLAHVALRDDYDLEESPEGAFKLPLYEYSVRAIGAGKKYFQP